MTCTRCNGRVLAALGGELACINCGFDPTPVPAPLPYHRDRRGGYHSRKPRVSPLEVFEFDWAEV